MTIHPRTTRQLALVALIAAAGVGLAACGSSSGSGSSTGSSTNTPVPPSTSVTASAAGAGGAATTGVSSASTSIGTVLVDGSGRTLYLLTADGPSHSVCTGGCVSAWPLAAASLAAAKPGAGVTATLGTMKRTDGSTQLTVDGHPAYTFAGDGATGDANGQGVTSYGGTWYAFTPSGGEQKSSAAQPKSGY